MVGAPAGLALEAPAPVLAAAVPVLEWLRQELVVVPLVRARARVRPRPRLAASVALVPAVQRLVVLQRPVALVVPVAQRPPLVRAVVAPAIGWRR